MSEIEINHRGIKATITEEAVASCAALGIDAIAEIKEGIDSSFPHAVIFSKPNCGFCVKAKALFEKNDIAYEEVSAVENREMLIEMVTEASGQPPRSVPQIFIDGAYVGGHDQLVVWLQERENAVRQDQG